MVRQELDSTNECARRGYDLWIVCGGYERVVRRMRS